jgi:hypothetical protein
VVAEKIRRQIEWSIADLVSVADLYTELLSTTRRRPLVTLSRLAGFTARLDRDRGALVVFNLKGTSNNDEFFVGVIAGASRW